MEQTSHPTPAVLLDLDGTLSDSRPGLVACFRFMLARLGHDPDQSGDLTWAVGPPIGESAARLLGQFGDTRVEAGLKFYRQRYSVEGLYECSVYPGIVDMLAALREAGASLFVATSKRRDYAERVIDYLGLRNSIRAVYGALPGGGLDDKADLLAHILQAEQLPAARCVMVGDRLHDIRAAKANAMRSIGALWGYGGRAELEAAGASGIAATPADVVPMVVG